MTDNLLYTINAVAPILIISMIGIMLAKRGFISSEFILGAETIVFKLSLPAMLFIEISSCDVSKAFDKQLIIFCVCSVTLSFLIVSLISYLLIKDKAKLGAFIQGACRSNFAVLGLPLAHNMFGESGTLIISVVMPFVIIMFNAYSVIILSVFSPNKRKVSGVSLILTTLKNIITNPLIIAVMLALPFMFLKLRLPMVFDKTLNYIALMTTPLALICLGANFNALTFKNSAKSTFAAAFIKTVLLPLAAVLAAVLIGFRGEELGVVLILFGAPSAVSSYIMAKNMMGDHDLASHILLVTTILCIPTMFVGIFILKSLCLI